MMFRRAAAGCAAIAALWVFPVHAQGIRTDPPGWIQEKPLPPPPPLVSPLPHWYEVRDGAWQVPLPMLRELAAMMEAKLANNAYFNGKDGATPYAIQFRGELVDGKRIVRMAGECHVSADARPFLSVRFQDIRDGGRCVFDAEYDPAEQRISYFRYHGHA